MQHFISEGLEGLELYRDDLRWGWGFLESFEEVSIASCLEEKSFGERVVCTRYWIISNVLSVELRLHLPWEY